MRGLWASRPDTARYEQAAIIAEGDLVMVHGQYSGVTDKPLLSVDIFQFRDGQMVAHWDVGARRGPGGAGHVGPADVPDPAARPA